MPTHDEVVDQVDQVDQDKETDEHKGGERMMKCDECGKTKKVEKYMYPSNSPTHLCDRCARDSCFDLITHELINLTCSGEDDD